MNLARGREYSAMERSIDVRSPRLHMVEEDPAHPRSNRMGLGYVFVPDGSTKHEANALLAAKFAFARTLLLIVCCCSSFGDDLLVLNTAFCRAFQQFNKVHSLRSPYADDR